MVEMESYDLVDDADYAASQQQGSQSIMRSDSDEPEGGEVVYEKDNVSIHPTQYMSERISGRLKLVKHDDDSVFMMWIPYKGQHTNTRLSERDRELYTIRPLPITDVRSIRRHTPAFGWQYVIVVLSSGLAFPPLYFYNGGIKEFLATIKQYVSLVRSADDANVFIVNDFQDPLQKTLSSLELHGVISGVASSSAAVALSPTSASQEEGADCAYDSNSSSELFARPKYKVNDPARDFSIQLLEKFSLVTKFARETTTQLFRENSSENFLPNLGREQNHIPALPAPQMLPSNDLRNVTNEGCIPEDPLEFDKLALNWGNPRQPPLSKEEWDSFLDSEGRVCDSETLKKRVFYGGISHEVRREVWPFLLGYYEYNSTYAEREYLQTVRKEDYEIIKLQWQSISPEQAKRFTKFRERKGLIDKDVVRTDRSFSYYDGDDNPHIKLLYDILLTYSFYNFDLGYCQGMNDYLSPLLFVMEDESDTFWCFVALMERIGPNFNRDQSGMHSQLFALSKLVELADGPLHDYFKQNDCLNYFFCFRWILMQFKRELRYEETLLLWEVLWTHHLTEHLHLYMCVAILKKYRSKIIGERMGFDTLLKFINELSGHIDIEATLRDAEALCMCLGETGAACIPPGTPPSLPLVKNTRMSSHLEDEIL